jgi:hypothetical protein
MDRDLFTNPLPRLCDDAEWRSELEELLHPAEAFNHPTDVVNDPDLTLNEKRAILASWASDASAVEAAPLLRSNAAGKKPVCFDEVMQALRALDLEAQQALGTNRPRRSHRARRRPFFLNGGPDRDPDNGAPLI